MVSGTKVPAGFRDRQSPVGSLGQTHAEYFTDEIAGGGHARPLESWLIQVIVKWNNGKKSFPSRTSHRAALIFVSLPHARPDCPPVYTARPRPYAGLVQRAMRLFTSELMATKFNLSLDYAPHRAEHASLPGHTAVFWRQSLCSCGPRTMEQSSIAPKWGGLTVQSIPAVAKDIFCLDSGATAQCELFLLRRIEMILLTYLYLGLLCR